MANTDLKRNTSTESAREMWNAVDSAAEKAPQWIKDKMNVANTDERLKAFLEVCEKATPEPWEWNVDNYHGGYSGITGKDNAEVLFPDHCNEDDDGAAWFEEFPSVEDGKLIVEARTEAPFAAQKALEAREALRAIDKIVMQPTRSDLLTLSGVLCDIRRCYYKVLED